jgi:hypothetical protein
VRGLIVAKRWIFESNLRMKQVEKDASYMKRSKTVEVKELR